MKKQFITKSVLLLLISINLQTNAQTIFEDYQSFVYRKDPLSPSTLMIDTQNGRVGVNTATPTQTLEVNGKVLIRDTDDILTIKPEHPYNLWVTDGVVGEDLFIVDAANWADYVFEDNFNLLSLEKLDNFIKENKHLPNIPTALQVKNDGYSQHDINAKLLSKIEELTLYTIEQDKELKKQIEISNRQSKQINDLIELLENKNSLINKQD